MNNKQFFAYTAGYIDGDGCFYLGKAMTKTGLIKYRASLVISSVHERILEKFVQKFGGSYRLVATPKNGHKPQFQYSVHGKGSMKLIQNILPFLVEKKQQGEMFFKFIISDTKQEKVSLIEKLSEYKKTEGFVSQNDLIELEKSKSKIIPHQLDFAYLAGFIDAECAFGIQKYHSKNRPNPIYKTYLHLNNTKFPPFKWLMNRFGGNVRFIKRSSIFNKQNDQLSWRISSKNLENILPSIYPFIHHKKPVCKELMKFAKINIGNGGDRHSESFKKRYQSILIQKDLICANVHQLNRKGI